MKRLVIFGSLRRYAEIIVLHRLLKLLGDGQQFVHVQIPVVLRTKIRGSAFDRLSRVKQHRHIRLVNVEDDVAFVFSLSAGGLRQQAVRRQQLHCFSDRGVADVQRLRNPAEIDSAAGLQRGRQDRRLQNAVYCIGKPNEGVLRLDLRQLFRRQNMQICFRLAWIHHTPSLHASEPNSRMPARSSVSVQIVDRHRRLGDQRAVVREYLRLRNAGTSALTDDMSLCGKLRRVHTGA